MGKQRKRKLESVVVVNSPKADVRKVSKKSSENNENDNHLIDSTSRNKEVVEDRMMCKDHQSKEKN